MYVFLGRGVAGDSWGMRWQVGVGFVMMVRLVLRGTSLVFVHSSDFLTMVPALVLVTTQMQPLQLTQPRNPTSELLC